MDYIVAGLGNPGKEYTVTRHNAGWISIDYIADKLGVNVNKIKFKSTCAEADIGGKKVLLMKPQTFMNNSGEAIGAAAQFYKIPPQNVLVLCDDINLPTGKLRIRKKGSAGGHNGLKSIIAHLSSDEFPRVRIGVSDRSNSDIDLADWVLGNFTQEEQKIIFAKLENVFDTVQMFASDKLDNAMGKYNGD